jgi:hypothetical protein
MATATRSKTLVLEPKVDPEMGCCVQCRAATKWRVIRSGRYNYHDISYFCKSCWPPSVGSNCDYVGTSTYHYYGHKEATDRLIRTKE